MPPNAIKPYRYNDRSDKCHYVRWGRLNGINNTITQVVPENRNRVSLKLSIAGFFGSADVYFGGPTGVNGTFKTPLTGGGILQLLFTIDDEPALATSDVWFGANPNPGDGAVVELFCTGMENK